MLHFISLCILGGDFNCGLKVIAMPLICIGDGIGDLQSAEHDYKSCLVIHCAYNIIVLTQLTLFPKFPVCISTHMAMHYLTNDFCRALKEFD